MLGCTLRDSICRNFIIQNHGCPTLRFPLRTHNGTFLSFTTFFQNHEQDFYLPLICNCMEQKIIQYQQIPLQKLPITVGKMAGAVDLVLNDQSVSRLHARISRDGNRFFITDLNSTNGTFRNGMRLEPNASEIIEPGDEIGIGKLKFIYR